jgi:hypothetical protein
MLSSINWLRQLIARDMAKQHQLKNQLTKSHESSLPTIGRDMAYQVVRTSLQKDSNVMLLHVCHQLVQFFSW